MRLKRILSLALVLAMIGCLAACGSSSKSQLASVNERIAKEIVAAVDDYLDGNISASEAHDLIASEEKSIAEDADSKAGLMKADTALIQANLTSMKISGGGDLDRILECRNEIAEMAGMKQRD